MRENLKDGFRFTPSLKDIPYDSTFVNPFINFLTPPLIQKRVARKQVAVIHDLIPLKYPDHFPTGIRGKFDIFLNKHALKNYDMIVTNSETTKKDVVEMLQINDKQVKAIYPVLQKTFTAAAPETIPGDLPTKYCIYVGDATWNKNLVTLAKAIKEINVTCIFVGKVFGEKNVDHPWQQELKDFLSQTAGDKRFIFKGYVSDSMLVTLYEQAVVNILSSRDEGFGFSYLEAASQGTPSVLADIPTFREVSDGKGALFAPVNDVSGFSNAIGEFYFRKGLRDEFGSKAFQRSKYFKPATFSAEWKIVSE